MLSMRQPTHNRNFVALDYYRQPLAGTAADAKTLAEAIA